MTQQLFKGDFEGPLYQIDAKGRGTDVKGRVKWVFHGDRKGPLGLPKVFFSVFGAFRKKEAIESNRSTCQNKIKVRAVKFKEFHQ